MNRYTQFGILKVICATSLCLYSGLVTFWISKMKIDPIIIAVDDFGTRVLNEDDRLVKIEKENFLIRFLGLQYEFGPETYSSQISLSGDLMSNLLWEKKKKEFLRIAEKLKKLPLRQHFEVEELREIDALHYEADLKIVIQNRLQQKDLRYRVGLGLHSKKRDSRNPYPFEVDSLTEVAL